MSIFFAVCPFPSFLVCFQRHSRIQFSFALDWIALIFFGVLYSALRFGLALVWMGLVCMLFFQGKNSKYDLGKVWGRI